MHMTWLPWLLAVVLAQQPVTVGGDVADATGLPLPGVVVSVKGTTLLAVSDDHGRFRVAVTTAEPVLLLALPGFRTKEIALKSSGLGTPIHVTLDLEPLSNSVIVRAPASGTPPDARMTLRPLDVVRTAGAQADLLRALAVLPGVVHVDEGAGLFVRGGDVSETLVLLDAVPLAHPYRYETPTGGFRGAVDPFLTQGVSFTTGGFSAEYGNSLSGVVDMRGVGRPTVPRVNATAGLAGVSGMFAQPIGAKGGFRLSANRTTPSLLFAVNPSPTEFDRLPGGWDVSASGHVDSATRGTFRVFLLEQRDHVGVELERDAFSGFLHSGASHRLLTATWQRPLPGNWSASAAAGTDAYANATDAGVFALATRDRGASARVDVGGPAGAWNLRVGGEAGRQRTETVGRVPTRGGDFAGVGGSSAFDVSHGDWHAGGYVEASRTFGRFTPTLGLRSDYFAEAGAAREDPRLNLTYDLGAPGRLRFAWGLYHQAPSPDYFDAVRGASHLAPMAATHYVAAYEIGKFEGAAFFRAEAYVKTYRELPVEDAGLGFADSGHGRARGVDLFLRRVWHFIDVRASASFLDAARRWTPADARGRYPLPAGTWTPDFAVPFTWQLVVNAPISRLLSLGAAWRTAAGRPLTPVMGATLTASGYEPVWGPINSERLPRYERLDLSLSLLRTFRARTAAVFFVSLDNVLGRKNFFQYAYSPDYRERHPVPGASPRSVYVGCSITR
jgi:hypothetical protein